MKIIHQYFVLYLEQTTHASANIGQKLNTNTRVATSEETGGVICAADVLAVTFHFRRMVRNTVTVRLGVTCKFLCTFLC